MFIIDTTDRVRFREVEEELHKLLETTEMQLQRPPVLVLGNKIDAANAVSEMELLIALKLDKAIDPINNTFVSMCSVTHRQGYQKGLEWLSKRL